MPSFFKTFFSDPMKKKIFIVTLVSVLVLGAVVVAIVLGGKSGDANGSFFEKDQKTSEAETTKNSTITTPSIPLTPDSEKDSSGSSFTIGSMDTTPGYGSLIRPKNS